jgi:hypothetical protein
MLPRGLLSLDHVRCARADLPTPFAWVTTCPDAALPAVRYASADASPLRSRGPLLTLPLSRTELSSNRVFAYRRARIDGGRAVLSGIGDPGSIYNRWAIVDGKIHNFVSRRINIA